MRGSKVEMDAGWLRHRYVEDGKSQAQIAEELGCSQSVIWKYMQKFEIPARSDSEAVHLRKANHCNLSKEAMDFLDGELLGDMWIFPHRSTAARIGYESKYREYVEWISSTLDSFGISQCGKIRMRINSVEIHGKRVDTVSYRYLSRSYAELLKLRYKWYPGGTKDVPDDLRLTKLVCRQWYIGDGYVLRQKQKRGYGPCSLQLCTDSFSVEGNERLVAMLRELGFSSARWRTRNRIAIHASSTPDFLSFIGECPVGCYAYKWNVMGRVPGSEEFSGHKPGGKNV